MKKPALSGKGKLLLLGAAMSLFLAAVTLVLLLRWESQAPEKSSFSASDPTPRYLETTYPIAGLPPNPTLRDRFFVDVQNFMIRHGRKNPGAWTFSATPVRRCSIHGLLNQCMQVTGTRYLIDPEAACGSVEFGHTNSLTGAQWVATFEGALQTNQPECLDLVTHHLYRTNLVLIRERPGLVKVISQKRLAEFQRAGLVHTEKGN